MPYFEYKAKTDAHKTVTGVVEADTPQHAVDKIVARGQSPLELGAPRADLPAGVSGTPLRRPLGTVISGQALSIFTRQLGDLLDGGVTVLRALDLLGQQMPDSGFKVLLGQMSAFVRDGGSLSGAMGQYPDVFFATYIHMVKCGEISGKLAGALLHLADLMDHNVEMQKRIVSGLMYPMMILVVGIGTIFVLMTFVLPRLAVIFEDFDTALPWPTQVVMGASHFLESAWWLILGILGVVIFYLRRWYAAPAGRLWVDSYLLKVPLVKAFIYEAEVARFARGLGTLLDNGVPVAVAIESSAAVVENVVLKEEIRKAALKVRSGLSLSNALKGSSLFGDMAISLVAVGEESGRLEQGLFKLTAIYERNVKQTAELFIGILGPTVLVVVVGVVGCIVLAILLPILKMNMIVN